MAKQRRIPLWLVLLATFAIIVSCQLYSDRISRVTDVIKAETAQAEQILADQKTQMGTMSAELARKDTDAYYVEMARTLYGMVQKGEYRIQVTNPEIFDTWE